MSRNILRFAGFTAATICTGCAAKVITKEYQVSAGNVMNEDENRDLLSVSHSTPSLKLKNVQIIFRHGARTPIHIIPKIEEVTYSPRWFGYSPGHTSYSYEVTNLSGGPRQDSPLERHYRKTVLKGGMFVGQLTSTGQEQAYMLGKELQQEYIKRLAFISSKYNPNEIYVRSTNTERTLGSLRCALAGIFGKAELSEKGPVRFLIDAAEDDALLPGTTVCPVLRLINHFAMIHHEKIPEVNKQWQKIEELLGLGEEHRKKVNFIDVRDDLIARKTHGFPIPSIFLPHVDMIEKNAAKLIVYAFCGYRNELLRETALRLSAGRFIDFLITNVDDAVSNKRCLWNVALPPIVTES